MRRSLLIALTASFAFLTACTTTTTTPTAQSAPQKKAPLLSVSQASSRLASIKARVEPVAERECKARTKGMNCDFLIQIDKKADAPPNAYQTVSKSGRPMITFTAALVSDARNNDELAFVMGHEAAHHMMGHIGRQQNDAMAGAVIVGILAAAAGADASVLDAAMDVGATVGARAYSKNYELEADRLGTIVTHRAGYNPVRGAEYFTRIPDPGNQFLGTHPPNSQRIAVVKQTAAKL
ncbi:Peptidase family M48 [Shimia gijangensis]|uniref:Peptidase family M48 n=1 Tax=Shimia gijangensis TaxID=1470563 RepID=A0A1M6Q8J2_9RHOB|nr:M48 family metalloprotease [Shimia gijangensis]SHK16521.1 Peptidase family M48 [Shimia gijangensis]